MNLKKLTAFSMAAVLSLSLFGCSAKEDTTLSRYLDENGYIKDVDTTAVTLVDYDSLVIPADQHTPTEESIAAWMNYQLPSQNVYEGEVYDGATLNIDYIGYIDGVAFPGGDTNGMGTEVTIGVTQYIDDFLAQLVGHKVGENFEIEVTFPEDYHNTELAGKDATFMITINHLVEPIAARDLTDEVVKEALGEQGIETVEAFREQAVEYLTSTMVGNYVYAEIFEKSTVDPVAQTAVDFQTDYIVQTTTQQAEAYGVTLEELLSMYGMGTVEEFKEQNAEVIASAAKELCITQAIAEKEGITVEKADIEEYFGGQDYSGVEKAYGKNFVKFIILQSKTLDYLTANIARG